MKIRTKTGDKGSTALTGGARMRGDDLRIEMYEALDELDTYLGALGTLLTDTADEPSVQYIRPSLFVIGSYLAYDSQHLTQANHYHLQPNEVNELEQKIDRVTQTLPPQKTFLLPSGYPTNVQARVRKAVCQRTERRMVSSGEVHPIQLEILAFTNRLLDYLFVLARKINFNKNVMEKKWELSWQLQKNHYSYT